MRCAATRSGFAGAIRWVQRRVRLVHAVLVLVIGLLPEQLERCVAEVGAVRARLATDSALVALRATHCQAAPRAARAVGVPLNVVARRRFAIGVSNTRWGLTLRLRLRTCCAPT